MAIEKRFHQRMVISADVDIHILHRERHIMAKARNITPYGMLISTDKLTVPSGMLLELSIEIAGYVSTVPGLVIWSNQQKIGVMFPQIQPELFTAAEALSEQSLLEKNALKGRELLRPASHLNICCFSLSRILPRKHDLPHVQYASI